MLLSSLIRRRYSYGIVAAVSSINNNYNYKYYFYRTFVSSSSIEESFFPRISYSVNDFGTKHHHYVKLVSYFDSILTLGHSPMSHYNFIFSSLFKLGFHSTVAELFQQLQESQLDPSNSLKRRIFPDIHTWTILLHSYSLLGNMSLAIQMFLKIIDNDDHVVTTKTLNLLLQGFICKGLAHEAIICYTFILKKGFQLNLNSYLILIHGLCVINGGGQKQTQIAIQLLRHALQIFREDPEEELEVDVAFDFKSMYDFIIYKLSKDRLVNQAYDLCHEMIHVINIQPDSTTYYHLIYGYCIVGQFKQAIAMFRKLEESKNIYDCPSLCAAANSLVTEFELKSAKTVVAVMIRGGIKPNIASYHSVVDQLYIDVPDNVTNYVSMVQKLLLSKPKALCSLITNASYGYD